MPTWATVILSLIGVACLRRSIRNLLMSPWDGTVWLLDSARHTLAGWHARLRDAAHQRLVEVDLDGGRAKVSFLVFGTLMAAAFAVCAGTEALLVALSMQALLSIQGTALVSPLGTENLLVGSLIVAGVVAISVWITFQDSDRPSHIVPLHWFGPRARNALRAIAGAATMLVVVAVAGLAILRAHEVIQADAELASAALDLADSLAPAVPEAGGRHLPEVLKYSILVSAGLAMLAVTALTYEAGVAVLLRLQGWIITWAGIVLVSAARTVLGLLWTLARAARALVGYLLDGVLAVATIVARIPVSAVQALYAWGVETVSTPPFLRPIKGAVAVLTSIAVDIQIPDPQERSHTGH